MTVRTLTPNQKDTLVSWYSQKLYNQKQIAERFNTSERTVNRVLIERGLATPVARIKGEAHQLVKLVRSYGLTNADLEKLLQTVGSSVALAEESRDILATVRSYKLTADQLRTVLAAPALTHENVQLYLNRCSRFVLSQLFYNSGLVKVAELAQENARNAQQEKAPAAMAPIPTKNQQEMVYAPIPG